MTSGFDDLVRRRRMTRAFSAEPVAARDVDDLCAMALRGPSAGNSAGLDLLVLDTAEGTRAYWDTTLPMPRRSHFAWPGLLSAPVIVVMWVDPNAYVARYREPDKARSGLGEGPDAWPVPYWFVDGGAAAMSMLLGATDRGLGALFFGLFEHESAVRDRFGVPELRRAVGSIALGHPVAHRKSKSATRPRSDPRHVIHRGHWGQ